MPENKEYITKTEPEGSINISEDVLCIIAFEAIKEIEGVGGVGSSIGKEISDIIGKKNSFRGVRVSVEDEDVTVDAMILVKYGYGVGDIAKQVQVAVSKAIEDMTGLNVVAVNVRVSGVTFEKEK